MIERLENLLERIWENSLDEDHPDVIEFFEKMEDLRHRDFQKYLSYAQLYRDIRISLDEN